MDIWKVSSHGYIPNCFYKLYAKTEIVHDTMPSYRIDVLAERYNRNLLRLTELTVEKNNQVMKELYLIRQNIDINWYNWWWDNWKKKGLIELTLYKKIVDTT